RLALRDVELPVKRGELGLRSVRNGRGVSTTRLRRVNRPLRGRTGVKPELTDKSLSISLQLVLGVALQARCDAPDTLTRNACIECDLELQKLPVLVLHRLLSGGLRVESRSKLVVQVSLLLLQLLELHSALGSLVVGTGNGIASPLRGLVQVVLRALNVAVVRHSLPPGHKKSAHLGRLGQ